MLHLQIFYPILRAVFLFMVSFAVQKFLSLVRFHLFIFVFVFISLGSWLKKILLWFMSKSVLPIFSSKCFIVSGLIFRFLIHFEFIFLYSNRQCSSFILLHAAPFIEETVFSPLYILASFVRDCGFISDHYTLFH